VAAVHAAREVTPLCLQCMLRVRSLPCATSLLLPCPVLIRAYDRTPSAPSTFRRCTPAESTQGHAPGFCVSACACKVHLDPMGQSLAGARPSANGCSMHVRLKQLVQMLPGHGSWRRCCLVPDAGADGALVCACAVRSCAAQGAGADAEGGAADAQAPQDHKGVQHHRITKVCSTVRRGVNGSVRRCLNMCASFSLCL